MKNDAVKRRARFDLNLPRAAARLLTHWSTKMRSPYTRFNRFKAGGLCGVCICQSKI
jgi:hypothetical protein